MSVTQERLKEIVQKTIAHDRLAFDNHLMEMTRALDEGAEQLQTKAMEFGFCDGISEDDLDAVLDAFVREIARQFCEG
jgi:hypothetical protein